MATPIDIMKSDYMTVENITTRLRTDGVQEYLKFKSNGEYDYFECENCDGPMLGHQVAKCRYSEGYEEKTVVRFKKWLDKIPELRRLLEARITYRAERATEKQVEVMGFVSKSLQERIGDERTVERILTIMAGKFSRTICEQNRDTTEKARASKTDETVDSLIDDETIPETAKLEMSTPRGEHVASAKFGERLEESGKMNATERPWLKDILEEHNGTPKIGKTKELMKREPKSLKAADKREKPFVPSPTKGMRGLRVVENRDEPLAPPSTKETLANDATSDNRSRIDSWRSRLQSRGYRRPESRPGYFRTASKGRYIRDSSQFSGKSPSRPTSRPDQGGIRSLSRGKSPTKGTGKRDKSRSELVKKAEGPGDVKKSIAGVPRIEEMSRKIEKTPHVEKTTFPIIMKTNDDEPIEREATAHVIESDEVDFLGGEGTLQGWRKVLNLEDKKPELKKQSHLAAKLQRVGIRKKDGAVFLVAEEKEMDAKDNEREKSGTFGENRDSKVREPEQDRRRTRLRTAEEGRRLKRNQTAAFQLQTENTERYDKTASSAVESPTKERKRPEASRAKGRELKNPERYEVSEETDDAGQETVGSRRGTTKKKEEKESDGQKCQYSLAGTKSCLETGTEEIKRTLDVSKIEDRRFRSKGKEIKRINGRVGLMMEKDAENPEDRFRMKTPRKHAEQSNRLTANSRPNSTGHALKLAKKRRRDDTIGGEDTTEKKIRRKETKEENEPPDEIEELQKYTCQGKRKLDLSKEEKNKKGVRDGAAKQKAETRWKEEEMYALDPFGKIREEEDLDMIRETNASYIATESAAEVKRTMTKNRDPQKFTRHGKRQLKPPTDGNNDESGGNVEIKQQAEARPKVEKTTEKPISLRF